MTYQKATEYLFSRRQMGMKLGLEKIHHLLERLGHPENTFHSIHIAGTNGKGSTAAILESILREAGYCTGLYTSPHLIDMRERIQIRGRLITEKEVIFYMKRLKPHIEAVDASFFECLTAMAFLYFRDHGVDIAVLETGLGGRLDATNVVKPLLTMISDIGFDHTKILGKSLKDISREKAGIFKPGVPCIFGTRRRNINQYFTEMANKKHVPVIFSHDVVRTTNIRMHEEGSTFNLNTDQMKVENLYLSLVGKHQVYNTMSVMLAVEFLNKNGWQIQEKAVRSGMKNVIWRARLELLQRNPKILLDSAHNPLGIKRLVQALSQIFTYHRLILIFGVLKDKDYKTMCNHIVPLVDHVVLTRPLNERALEPEILAELSVFRNKRVEVIPDIKIAWKRVKSIAEKEDMICGAGSIYFVGELLRLWRNGI